MPALFEKTPARGIKRSRNEYRWEERICEWIASIMYSRLVGLVWCNNNGVEAAAFIICVQLLATRENTFISIQKSKAMF